MKSKGCRKLPAGGFLLITSARKDGKARILWKTCVASGELAEKKVGPAVGFDRTCVNAIRAEAFVGSFLRHCRICHHREKLNRCGVATENRRRLEWALADQHAYFAAANLLLPSLTFARNRRASSWRRSSCLCWSASLGINSPPTPRAEAPARM